MIRIDSLTNPRIKQAVRLRKQPTEDCFWIEGTRFAEELPVSCILEVYVTDAQRHAAFLSALPEQTPVFLIPQAAMDKICAASSSQTIACAVRKEPTVRPEKLILLDGVQDPGNVGTVIRTAYAFGFGVILSPGCANPYSAKTLMSTAGAFRTCHVEQSDDLARTVSELRGQGYAVLATALDPNACTPDGLSVEGKRAIVVGSEGNGISAEVLRASDQTVFIPMQNPINSLNAACAASIMLYLLR